jgi:hypothetical protein
MSQKNIFNFIRRLFTPYSHTLSLTMPKRQTLTGFPGSQFGRRALLMFAKWATNNAHHAKNFAAVFTPN